MSSFPNPRRWLNRRTAAIAVAGVAVTAAGLHVTGAVFTDQKRLEADVATGTVEIEAGTAASSAPIQASDVLPGDTGTTTIDVENVGSVPVYYMIEITDESPDPELAAALDVTVASGGESTTRPLTGFGDGRLVVPGALGDGDTAPVAVSYALDLDAEESLQGMAARFGITIHAVQTRNVSVEGGWRSSQ